jgi:hypothetical protein
MALSTNYNNRTVDLLIFQGLTNGDGQANLTIGDEGYVCSGIQKVAQTFINLFLTDEGSNPWEPTKGTSFLVNIRNGSIRDGGTLNTQFSLAVSDIRNYLNTTEQADLPEDEQFDTAELLSWSFSDGKLTIQVRVWSVSGESRDYVIPAQVAIR